MSTTVDDVIRSSCPVWRHCFLSFLIRLCIKAVFVCVWPCCSSDVSFSPSLCLQQLTGSLLAVAFLTSFGSSMLYGYNLAVVNSPSAVSLTSTHTLIHIHTRPHTMIQDWIIYPGVPCFRRPLQTKIPHIPSLWKFCRLLFHSWNNSSVGALADVTVITWCQHWKSKTDGFSLSSDLLQDVWLSTERLWNLSHLHLSAHLTATVWSWSNNSCHHMVNWLGGWGRKKKRHGD